MKKKHKPRHHLQQYVCAIKNSKSSSPLQQQQQFMVIDDMYYVYAYESMNNNSNEIMINLLKRSFVCNVASMWFVPLWATKSSYIIIIIIIMTIIIIIIVKMQLSSLQHENQRRSGHAFSLITHELCVILRNYYITLIFLVLHTTSQFVCRLMCLLQNA